MALGFLEAAACDLVRGLVIKAICSRDLCALMNYSPTPQACLFWTLFHTALAAVSTQWIRFTFMAPISLVCISELSQNQAVCLNASFGFYGFEIVLILSSSSRRHLLSGNLGKRHPCLLGPKIRILATKIRILPWPEMRLKMCLLSLF